MSFNVMIVFEDYVKDQYIAKPVVQKIAEEIGKHNANVVVCKNPRFTGISTCPHETNLHQRVIRAYARSRIFPSKGANVS